MYRFSIVANVLAELSRFLLLECMEQIEPDNPNEICCMHVCFWICTARLGRLRGDGGPRRLVQEATHTHKLRLDVFRLYAVAEKLSRNKKFPTSEPYRMSPYHGRLA